MITMVDEIFDRHYQAGRAELNAGLARAFSRFGRTIGDSFRTLHRIEWSAPWRSPDKPARRA
jgi:hypothetical protein